MIGTSGTILSLGTVAAHEISGEAPEELRNLRVPAKALRPPARERHVAVAGRARCACRASIRAAPISSSPARCCSTRSCEAARRRRDHAVRSGAARRADPRLHPSAPQGHRARRSLSRRPPPERRRARRTLRYWADHASKCAAVALALFDQTRGIHGLTDREREWLEYAALLHDIGVHVSYEKHHRHSYYLIKNGDLRGFDPDEIEVMALITRYHRRATPKKDHPGYGDLPSGLRKVVKALSACLRLAEGLDRSHSAGARVAPARRSRRRLSGAAAHQRRHGARIVGRRPPCGRVCRYGREAGPVRSDGCATETQGGHRSLSGRRHGTTRHSRSRTTSTIAVADQRMYSGVSNSGAGLKGDDSRFTPNLHTGNGLEIAGGLR